MSSGEVIGLTQRVLPAGVQGIAYFKRSGKPSLPYLKGEIQGLSNIGLTHGLSHNVLDGIVEGVRKEVEEGKTHTYTENIFDQKRVF